MNVAWSQRILSELFRVGVRDAVCCAGARNSPLVAMLARSSGFRVHSFFEERSAGFFALGVARRTNRPVAVLTTSGTAAAELLPAAIEAFYTGVPLILVTADRPRRLRGTGAPQSIDQTGLYAKFVALEFDLQDGQLFSLRTWKKRAPVHINVCFDEPLLDQSISQWELPGRSEESAAHFAGTCASPAGDAASLRRFMDAEGRLIVIVSTLETSRERTAVVEFLKRLQAPVYLECTSGLRENAELQGFALRSSDRIIEWAAQNRLVSRILRIGGVPTARIWRDLDDSKSPIEVFSVSPLAFAGLSRGSFMYADVATVFGSLEVRDVNQPATSTLMEKDRECEQELLALFETEPAAEPSLVRAFSRLIQPADSLYLGNSLPIRNFDLAAAREHPFNVHASRGANGIDGQISTFLGWCEERRENWALIGDLTALYDLSAPWALRERNDLSVHLAVLNNGGGRIFSRMFGDPIFENRHALDFERWAEMWELGYTKWERVPEHHRPAVSTHEVLEIVPDDAASTRFWHAYNNLWMK